jgi:hypothetical protein
MTSELPSKLIWCVGKVCTTSSRKRKLDEDPSSDKHQNDKKLKPEVQRTERDDEGFERNQELDSSNLLHRPELEDKSNAEIPGKQSIHRMALSIVKTDSKEFIDKLEDEVDIPKLESFSSIMERFNPTELQLNRLVEVPIPSSPDTRPSQRSGSRVGSEGFEEPAEITNNEEVKAGEPAEAPLDQKANKDDDEVKQTSKQRSDRTLSPTPSAGAKFLIGFDKLNDYSNPINSDVDFHKKITSKDNIVLYYSGDFDEQKLAKLSEFKYVAINLMLNYVNDLAKFNLICLNAKFKINSQDVFELWKIAIELNVERLESICVQLANQSILQINNALYTMFIERKQNMNKIFDKVISGDITMDIYIGHKFIRACYNYGRFTNINYVDGLALNVVPYLYNATYEDFSIFKFEKGKGIARNSKKKLNFIHNDTLSRLHELSRILPTPGLAIFNSYLVSLLI